MKLNGRYKKYLKKYVESQKLDADTIDYTALWDSHLSYSENKERLKIELDLLNAQ